MDPAKFCPGDARPAEVTTWYYPKGSSLEKESYCQFCLKFGCLKNLPGKLVSVESNRCNCDCPDPSKHASQIWESIPYVCQSCAGKPVPSKITEECVSCQRAILAEGLKMCEYCSSCQQKCLICTEFISDDESYWNKYPLLKIIQRTKADHVTDWKGRVYHQKKNVNGKLVSLFSIPSEKNREQPKTSSLAFEPA